MLQDFVKDDVKLFKRAVKFYDELGGRLTAAGHCLDLFACSLDQVGLAEMHPAVAASGNVPPRASCTPRQVDGCSLALLGSSCWMFASA